MPPVSLDELLVLIETGGVAGDDELKVVGIRNFPSDESWAPVRDYPEVSLFFGGTGRAQVKAEVDRAKKSWLYAASAVLIFLLAAFFFWWSPYVDAKDSAGEVVRLGKKLEAANRESSLSAEALKKEIASAQQKNKALDMQVSKLRTELAMKHSQLDAAASKGELDAAVASTLATSDKALRAEVSRLKKRVEQLNESPKFWPGAEVMQIPESPEDVRLVSTLPNNGYLYVIGSKVFASGTFLELNEVGVFGAKVFARVVNSYPHAGGGHGMSLHVPDPQDEDVIKIKKLKLGEVLKCSVSAGEK